ncbi:MAG: bifunctional methylenetetrahydrofolate dehydrogenase/methenyltetrahydrofolate cyclohydrolase FolD [Alphaproteobacteria bacterium]|nr:bifunctional methylenetetrahydrofolate dehydrogenase/methenyltetrahydrofolate cyclohydrolase FolD [Alphaproteobacteria bacterium]
MSARVIDGKAVAAKLRGEVGAQVAVLREKYGVQPGLAVVLVGEDPASKVYVGNKEKAVAEVGMASFPHHLPADTKQADLMQLVRRLNENSAVHGILVQMPLPQTTTGGLDAQAVIEAIEPAKDVDGFHPVNAGRLATGLPALVACTPTGCLVLLREVHENLAGKHAVVVGRSNIVGKPVAQLLLQADCTVTIAHSKTQNLPDVCRQADILVAAAGRAEMIKGDWIKPGATVIDVGINRIEDPKTGKNRLAGDVAFTEAAAVAGAITPVPGGVGPMTIACLLRNTLQAACAQHNITL